MTLTVSQEVTADCQVTPQYGLNAVGPLPTPPATITSLLSTEDLGPGTDHGVGAFHAFARFQEAQSRTQWPLICFAGEAVMSNAAGVSIMALINQVALREHALMVACGGTAASRTMPMADGRPARVEFEAIKQRSATVGVLVRVHEIDAVRDHCPPSLPGLVGESLPWRAAVRDAVSAAQSRRPTLLLGERGTGKAALAQAAMSWQPASGGHLPLKIIDCASLAAQGSPQRLEGALGDGSSHVVLKHIDALPAPWQLALSPVIEGVTSSGRLVWCTSSSGLKPLSENVATDLFDHVVHLPPLRHRADDIPLIVEQTLHGGDTAEGRPRIAPEAVQVLMRYRWPHNVAQLTAIIRGAAAKVGRPWIGVSDLPLYVQRDSARTRLTPYEAAEADVIRNALKVCEGNKSSAADLLGISRSTLYRKVRRYDLEFKRHT